jgi:EAL domain-containing protein (putative c-di-GMP-specific phosphodiesterase class I)
VDDVKIDGSFIRGLARSTEDRIFVKAIADVAHGVGKGVVAEFVESAEILDVLAGLGVEYAQGYHISHPVPENELRM